MKNYSLLEINKGRKKEKEKKLNKTSKIPRFWGNAKRLEHYRIKSKKKS